MPKERARRAARTARRGKTTNEDASAFTDEERAAMEERARELKAQARGEAEGEGVVLAKIAEMSEPDRTMAERIHEVVMASAPGLVPRTWYGMPAYAKGGKVLCFFQPAGKFKTRYATLGFTDQATLDEGAMWPVTFALAELTAAEEERIAALVRRAVG